MKFYFVYPTYNRPAGGLKQARLMAQRLLAAGVDVQLLRENFEFDDNCFFDIPVPSAEFAFDAARERIGADDVVIVPEYRLDRWLQAVRDWNCRVAVNNQNGYFALESREWDIQRRFGVEFVIANSTTVAEISRLFLGVDAGRIFLVPHLVVRPPFTLPESPAITGELAVAYMPRKCAAETLAIRDEVRRRRPDVPWVEIDGVPVDEVARRLRECRVFLSTQQLEGCPLPSLEAMASGCLVAGFAGTPGFPHPYATAANGFWARDMDVADAVEKVCRAIDVAREDGVAARRYAEAAVATLRSFTESAVDAALAKLIATVSGREYAQRRPGIPAMTLGARLNAYRRLKKIGRLFVRERIREYWMSPQTVRPGV